jgi:hypothetical protein
MLSKADRVETNHIKIFKNFNSYEFLELHKQKVSRRFESNQLN